MTEQEELRYLVSLTLAASDWRLSEGDERDPLRLEVQQRIARLLGDEPEIVDGREQSVVERGLAKAEARAKARRDAQRNSRRVTFPDGSTHRVDVEDLHQEPFPQSPTGYRWAINEDALDRYLQRYGIK